MNREKPYLNPQFLTNDIAKACEGLDFQTLKIVLEREGFNTQSYIRKCRVENICRLFLENPDASITDLLPQTGFSSAPALRRAFTAVMGVPPSEYVKNFKK